MYFIVDNMILLLSVMFFYYYLCIFFSGKKKVPWLGRENKPKPWQPRNLQKYHKKKQEYKIK